MALGDGIRRNLAHVSPEERARLRDAILKLDSDPRFVYPDGVSHWDKQEDIHKNAHSAGQDVHGGPAFLPWHRELCNRLEALLRQVDPSVSLHYWDWTTDPRASSNGAGGTVDLFTPEFMGAPAGNAGPPLQNFESTEGAELNDGHNFIWRQVAPGPPGIPSDQAIVTVTDGLAQADQWSRMTSQADPNSLHAAHDQAHGYIGGGIGFEHYSFHDPFVFLLHSNVDRLLAMWQRSPGQEWRLDPNQIYGSNGTSPSIVENLEPWSGASGLRPWAPPDNQGLVKTSKDPSVVSPPRYDTSPVQVLQLVGLTDMGAMWHTIRRADGSWQSSFGDVKGVESNDPGHFSATACDGVHSDMQLVAVTDVGGLWHTIRHDNGAWQPSFGDVKGQESNDPGHFSAVGCAGVNGELQLAGVTDDGRIWHTIRHHDGSWQASFGSVKDVESNDPGHFVNVSCAAVGGSTSGGQELHLTALTDDGRMWHTIRRADGSWQPFFGDVKKQESNDPGFFSAVGSAGVGGDLHVLALTDDGRVWHTIRHADGSWQPFFGDVKGQESNDPGYFSAVSSGAVNGEVHVVGLTDDGSMWHTIRHPDGSWQPFFGNVKSQESNDPGHFSAVGSGGVG